MNDAGASPFVDRQPFSLSYRRSQPAIPDVLTVMIWVPPLIALIFFMTSGPRHFHPDVCERLFPLGIPPIISCFVCLILATVCFQKGSRKTSTLVFGMICALWGFLNLDITLLFVIKDKHTALVMNRMDHAVLVFQLGLCTHYFHTRSGVNKRTVYLAYAVSLMFVPLTQTPYYLKGMHTYPWGFFGSGGILFHILIAMTLGVIVLGSRSQMRYIVHHATSPLVKKKALFSLVGIITMALINLANIPAMQGIDCYPMGTFIFLPMLILSYAMVRYDLVTINLYFKKRFWSLAAMALTSAGYLFITLLFVVTLRHLDTHDVFSELFPWGIPLLISIVTCFFFSVLSANVGPTLAGSRLFGLICMVLACLSSDILLNRLIIDPSEGLQISRLCHRVLVMWPALCLHLVLVACRKKAPLIVCFSYITGLCFAFFTHSSAYITGMKPYPWGLFAQRGPLFDVFCLYGLVHVAYCLWIFSRTARGQVKTLDRKRLKLFSLAILTAVLFSFGNVPAMWGFNVYPSGNFIFIPKWMFGYAMFRKNLKEVLALLSTFIYGAGLFVLFIAVSGPIQHWTEKPHPGLIFASGLAMLFILFKITDFSWQAFLSLFFHRQKNKLDSLYVQLVDQLSKTRSETDIVDALASAVFSELQTCRLNILMYDEEKHRFSLFERANLKDSEAETGISEQAEIPIVLPDHPLIPFYSQRRNAVSQEQTETWIADMDIALDHDDRLRNADAVQPVHWEGHLVCLLLFFEKEDGAAYSRLEREFISRIGLILGPHIENAKRVQNLEKIIRQRTADLSDFIARTSHEIRSPLNAILGMGDVLSETHLDSDQRACVETLLNSGGLLLSVINGILDFSRIEAQAVTVETVSFDLFVLMNDIKAMVSAVAHKKDLPVGLVIDANTPRFVRGDMFKISQILINLADNAIRFTEKGRLTFHVKRHDAISDPSIITFSVEDTGVGIPDDMIHEVFEHFAQAEASTSRKFGGTGLGLSICRKLSHLMGGTISVTSKPGCGTRFDVTLPLPEPSDTPDLTLPSRGLSGMRLKSSYEIKRDNIKDWPESLGPISVLAAEDIKTNIQVITLFLKGLPVHIDVAYNGKEAVFAFQNHSYDMVLMDLHMPDMDGHEATKIIRSIEKERGLARTPVIALSARAQDHVNGIDQNDFDGFLMKPFGRNDLMDIMVRHLQNRKPPVEIPKHLQPVVNVLAQEISEEIEFIRLAFECGDFETAMRFSHGFKGAAGNCGISELADLFSRLYDHAVQGDTDRAQDLIPTIRQHASRLSMHTPQN